jgi:hypothetical protein
VDGVALSGSDQSDVSAVATHEDGEWLTAFSRNASGQLTEVVYGTGDGERITVKLDEQGRPTVGVAGPYVATIGNYEGSRADVALLDTGSGEITTYEDVDLGVDLSTSNFSKQSDDLTPAEAFDAASVGVTAFVCTLAFIDISGFSAAACGASVLLQAGTRALQETAWGETAEWVGFGVDALECTSNGVACVAAGIDLGQQILEEDETQIEENEEEIAQASGVARFGGVWGYPDPDRQNDWFVVEKGKAFDAIFDENNDCYDLSIGDYVSVDGNVFTYERREDGAQIELEYNRLSEEELRVRRLSDDLTFTFELNSGEDGDTYLSNRCEGASTSVLPKLIGR